MENGKQKESEQKADSNITTDIYINAHNFAKGMETNTFGTISQPRLNDFTWIRKPWFMSVNPILFHSKIEQVLSSFCQHMNIHVHYFRHTQRHTPTTLAQQSLVRRFKLWCNSLIIASRKLGRSVCIKYSVLALVFTLFRLCLISRWFVHL